MIKLINKKSLNAIKCWAISGAVLGAGFMATSTADAQSTGVFCVKGSTVSFRSRSKCRPNETKIDILRGKDGVDGKDGAQGAVGATGATGPAGSSSDLESFSGGTGNNGVNDGNYALNSSNNSYYYSTNYFGDSNVGGLLNSDCKRFEYQIALVQSPMSSEVLPVEDIIGPTRKFGLQRIIESTLSYSGAGDASATSTSYNGFAEYTELCTLSGTQKRCSGSVYFPVSKGEGLSLVHVQGYDSVSESYPQYSPAKWGFKCVSNEVEDTDLSHIVPVEDSPNAYRY